MAIDSERIERFLASRPTRRLVAEVARHAGFTISWVIEQAPERWGMCLKLNKQQKELFGTNREILLWVVEYREFQPRTVTQAAEIIESERPRLSEDFSLVVAADAKTEKLVAESSDQLTTHFVGVPLDGFRDFAPHGRIDFVRWIQSRLFSKDLYWISTAVTTPSSFFGRKSLISELQDHLRRGSSHIGLFGLRKLGKTSLLYRVADNLRSNGELIVAHLDVQRLDAINPCSEYFLWSVGESLYDASNVVRRLDGLRMFGRHRVFFEAPPPQQVWELFDHDVRLILGNTRKKLILLFDEIELMSPEAPGSRWDDSFVRCWRLLRGLEQQHPGRISYLVTGTNPSCIEANRLCGIENPAYNYFSKRYLPRLTEGESGELLVTLGTKMGLQWEAQATRDVIRHTGGHPFLLRAFGSRIHHALLPRSVTRRVDRSLVDSLVPIFVADVNSILSQMVEVIADQYPNEYSIMQSLARGNIGEFRELAREFPDETSHLVGYGLIGPDFSDTGLRVEVLQTWMQRRIREKHNPETPSHVETLAPGTLVESYSVLGTLGKPGGLARVYRARNTRNDAIVALKVFASASFAALQREIDVLTDIKHPNIVKVLDHGKTAGGLVYMVMELLDGPTLLEKCERSRRLSAAEALQALKALLDAVQTIHPDEERLEALRKKQEVTVEELDEMERARHGYIHRDIKPANVIVVEHRGPVLIDFNISVRAAAPVKTLSATPGYLPPDGLAPVWTPDVDLYQIGLTVLQAATGIEYTGDNIGDLRLIAETDLPDPLRSVLLKMTNGERAKRYTTVREVLTQLSP